MISVHHLWRQLADSEDRAVSRLIAAAGGPERVTRIPRVPEDIADLEALYQLTRRLEEAAG